MERPNNGSGEKRKNIKTAKTRIFHARTTHGRKIFTRDWQIPPHVALDRAILPTVEAKKVHLGDPHKMYKTTPKLSD
jgi:hypothetical protein